MPRTDSIVGTAQQMGQQLRQAREAAGLSVDAVATQLRMHKYLLRALEAGDWSPLGAPVFVRGHLNSYARLLKIDLDALDSIHSTPTVIPIAEAKRGQQIFGKLGTRMVYVLVTALIGVPVWMATQRHLVPQTVAVTLNIPEAQNATPSPAPKSSQEPSIPPAQIQATSPPLTTVASLLPSTPQMPPPSMITLQLNQDSWVELYAPDGRSLEQNLLKAGDVRHFTPGQLGRVVVGNVTGVTLRLGEQIQDLSAYQRANVARFAVSSDGSIGPIVD